MIVSLYYLFIDHWMHFSKLFEFFVKVVDTRTSLEVFRVPSDWTQHRLCSIETICNVFYIRYLGWPAFLMKTYWTAGTQNLVIVTAVVSSWIGTGVIFTIEPMSLSAYTSWFISNLNYLSVTCCELYHCPILKNKIINFVGFSAIISSLENKIFYLLFILK